MAKKKDTLTPSMFKSSVPKMPEGYYSGDKPNPNLRAFVEQHLKENPYDPETDDYDVPAFDKPIETTKATAIYNMHTYWSKKPHDAIREYIRHYTEPGDLVLDPFCGSGGTALAALMEGRKAVAIDRSPAATFITKNYCTPVDVEELQAAFEKLKKKVKPEIDWLYETRCDRCGGKAMTGYTVYSQVFQCPRCLEKVPLFDCVEAEGRTLAGKAKKIKVCPHCHEKGTPEEISTSSERFGAVPVLVSYLCEGKCSPKRGERRHNDEDKKKRDYFEKWDLGKLKEIEGKDIPHWYPTDRMMHAPEDQECWGVKWRRGTSNFRTVDELFTKRNLWALAAIKGALGKPAESDASDVLLFALNAISLNCSRMYQYRPSLKGGFQKGTYYVPQDSQIIHVFRAFNEKASDLAKTLDRPPWGVNASLSTESATRLKNILPNSIDLIFTDPPYAEKVQYGELNFIWEAWLGFDTHWHNEEIIVNDVRGKTEADWADMMRQAMAECLRVLKPGRWLSLCYHDTSEGTWALVQDIMRDAGFVVDTSDAALFIDTGQKSYNQLTADKVNKRDLVINFRKPKPGEVPRGIAITGQEDETTFNEKVLTAIREFLAAHPGSTQDRIYDEVVSRMVRKGQMEAHNFEELLRQVADEIKETRKKNLFEEEDPDLFGRHEVGHWYLKETEEDADPSDQAVADAAAERVEQFIAKETEMQLTKTDSRHRELQNTVAKLEKTFEKLKDHDPDLSAAAAQAGRERGKVSRELKPARNELAKLSAERAEWSQPALHYTYISEFYFPLTPKPRATLVELLEDYFYQTDEGNWRPPVTDEERSDKAAARAKAARRRLTRYCRLLEAGDAIPETLQADDATLAEWLRYCKNSGLYAEGKLLYERGGLNLDHLSEEDLVNAEEDYQVCVRMLARAPREPKQKARKESRK